MDVLNPLTTLLDKMNFKKRFIFISVIVFLGFMGASFLYIKSEFIARSFLISELAPANYFKPMIILMQKLPESRISHLLAGFQKEDTILLKQATQADAAVDAAIFQLKNSNQTWNLEKMNPLINEIESDWNKLKTELDRGYTDDLFEKNMDISDKVIKLFSVVLDESKLSLDFNPTSSNLIYIFMNHAPLAAQKTQLLRGLGVKVLLQKELTQPNRDTINALLALSNKENDDLGASLKRLYNLDNTFRQVFSEQQALIEKAAMNALIKRNILESNNFDQSPLAYSDELAALARDYYLMADTAYAQFMENFDARLSKIDKHIIVNISCLLVAFLLICLIFIAFYNSTNHAMRLLIKNADAIAEGDLTQDVTINRADEFGILLNTLGNMQSKISTIVQKIRHSSYSVGRGAKEIAQGNLDLSKRTEQQATSLAQTAASMEELSVTVRENANQSKQAAQLAEHAREQADISGTIVNDAVDAMSQINARSKKISEISSLIDGIAFQTNLLALNAAIEAARAGEQGRGFAVVAQEVRSLAQRSSASAKEINTLISDSVDKISRGSELVTKSGDALQEIVKSASTVSEIVASIATATTQQAKGLEEINKAITQMDVITQQNAALVEETAAASENVNQQVKDLISLIGYFKDKNLAEHIVYSNMQETSETERHNTNHPISSLKNYVPKSERKESNESDWSEF